MVDFDVQLWDGVADALCNFYVRKVMTVKPRKAIDKPDIPD